jgi:hypothetical protein
MIEIYNWKNGYFVFDNKNNCISNFSEETILETIQFYNKQAYHNLNDFDFVKIKQLIKDECTLICSGESFNEIQSNYPEYFI